MKVSYLYPDGKVRDKRLTELSETEAAEALTPRVIPAAELRKMHREAFWLQVKYFGESVHYLVGVGVLLLFSVPYILAGWWKETK